MFRVDAAFVSIMGTAYFRAKFDPASLYNADSESVRVVHHERGAYMACKRRNKKGSAAGSKPLASLLVGGTIIPSNSPSYDDSGSVVVGCWCDVRVTRRLEISRSFPASDMLGNSFTVSRTMCSAPATICSRAWTSAVACCFMSMDAAISGAYCSNKQGGKHANTSYTTQLTLSQLELEGWENGTNDVAAGTTPAR